MKETVDVKMAERKMDRQCIFWFVSVNSSYLETESMFTTGKKKIEISLLKKQEE